MSMRMSRTSFENVKCESVGLRGMARGAMRRLTLVTLCLALMCFAVCLAGCGKKGELVTDVSWEQLCAANQPAAVLEQTGAYQVQLIEDEGYGSTLSVALQDGVLAWTDGNEHWTEDYRDGAVYSCAPDGSLAYVWFVPPAVDPMSLIADPYAGYSLDEFTAPDGVYLHDGQYLVDIAYEDPETGVTAEGEARFDSETMLLDAMDLEFDLVGMSSKATIAVAYDASAPLEGLSYNGISQAPDAIDVTVHTPDGASRDYRISADSGVAVYNAAEGDEWSLCWDSACTNSVDDLAWVEGGHADLYLCPGYVPPAPPTLSRVLERSTFEAVFANNYNSYNQYFTYYGSGDAWLGATGLAWILNENGGMEYYAETLDASGEPAYCAMGVDGAWYEWTPAGGYQVDFYGEGTFAANTSASGAGGGATSTFIENEFPESKMDALRFVIDASRLVGEPMSGEGDGWFWRYVENGADGSRVEYDYYVLQDYDYIGLVFVSRYDARGQLVSCDEIGIGGNGGEGVSRFIRDEVAEPGDADVVELTVVGLSGATAGEATYRIRTDARISWEGAPLYKDAACTQPVSDLSWVSGGAATVYAK